MSAAASSSIDDMPTVSVPKRKPGKAGGPDTRVDREMMAEATPSKTALMHDQRRKGIEHNGRVRLSIMDRAAQIKDSDDLLVLDQEIAVLKAVFAATSEQYSVEYEAYCTMIDMIAAGTYEGEEAPKIPNAPELNLDLIRTMNGVITTAYNMRFSKRFSVPVIEIENIMHQIKGAFIAVVKEHGLSQIVVDSFVSRLGDIKFSRTVDYQLDRAGGLSPGTGMKNESNDLMYTDVPVDPKSGRLLGMGGGK